ncbi:hypothetical protein LCGC14_0278530 [marine sediment metagenome]|uniref:Uncharacterized protein n=1 Tax=marine sediment metagenome TaxID=412755 RepID=A0A0F9TWW9_9ZZZZ
MPEDQNPSVVKEGGTSNYSMSRGELAKSDASYIDKLQKSFQAPSPGAQAKSTYFPSAGRPLQAGTFGSKSLGNIPIFVANAGLIPIGMLEARRKAEQDAAVKEFAMFGPANNEALDHYIELVNPLAQDEFNAKVQGSINTYLDDKAYELGGDYTKARMLTKYDPAFKNMIRSYQTYARMYNQLAPEAMDVLAKAADPTANYVDDETVRKAMMFIHNHDNLGTTSIDELHKYVGEFQAYMGIDKAVKSSLGMVKSSITTTIKENVKLSTDAYKVLERVEREGFYTDDEMDMLVEDAMQSYPYLESDPKARAMFKKKLRAGIKQTEKKTVTAVRREIAERQRKVGQSFGLFGNADRGYSGTKIPKYTDDGMRQYDTHQITLPSTNASKKNTSIDISPNDIVNVRNQKGEVIRGYFNSPLKARPTTMYKDPTDALQVSSSLDIQAMIDYVDPNTGKEQGLKKGKLWFNIVGGTDGPTQIDVIDLGGTAEIMIPEEKLKGQLSSQYTDEVWHQVRTAAMQTPTPTSKPRTEGGRNKFITMETATKDQKEWFQSKRERLARKGFEERKAETGLGTYIVDDIELKNKAGEWVSFEEVVAMGITNGKWTRESLMKGLNEGEGEFRIKSK